MEMTQGQLHIPVLSNSSDTIVKDLSPKTGPNKDNVNLYSDPVLYIYSDNQFNGVGSFVRVILPYSCNLIRYMRPSTRAFF